MSTILVVRPRKVNLRYEADEKTGIIHNSGNTFFCVIIQKGCDGDDESSTQFYMLPGERYSAQAVKVNNRKFVVATGRYLPLGRACFNETK